MNKTASTPVTIRLASNSDVQQMLDIYLPVVRDTSISFEVETPTLEEFRRRVGNTLKMLPWLVCEAQGRILGYAYAGRFRSRAGYRWSVEVSVYVDGRYRRRGVAGGLYTALLEGLRVLGYFNAYAGITFPNSAICTGMMVLPQQRYRATHRHGPGVTIVGVAPGNGFAVMYRRAARRSSAHGRRRASSSRRTTGSTSTSIPAARRTAGCAVFPSKALLGYDGGLNGEIPFIEEDPWVREQFEAALAEQACRRSCHPRSTRTRTTSGTTRRCGTRTSAGRH